MRPPYRASHGSFRSAAICVTRSASGSAPWCFHSLGHACGSPLNAAISQSGVPSPAVGRTVHDVKSIPMPPTLPESMPESASTFPIVRSIPVIQSAGF